MRWFMVLALAACALALGAQTLPEAWELARANNPSLQVAGVQAQVAAGEASRAHRAMLPTLTLGGRAAYNTDRPTMSIDASPLLPPMTMELGSHEQYDASLTLRQPLYTGGAIRGATQAAQCDADAAASEEQAAWNALKMRIAGLYGQLALLQRQSTILETSLQRLATQQQRVRALVAAGQAAAADTLELSDSVLQTCQRLLQLEAQQASTRTAIGMAVGAPVQPVLPVCEALSPLPTRQECEELALAARPELAAFDARLMGQQAREKQARSQRLPQLSAAVEYHYANPGVQLQQPEWGDYAVAGVQLQWQLWDWNRTRDGERQVRRGADVLRARRQEAEQTILAQIDDLYTGWQSTSQQLRLQEDIRRHRASLLQTAIQRHEQAQATILDVRDAERDLTTAEEDVARLRCELWLLHMRLRAATGWAMPEGGER